MLQYYVFGDCAVYDLCSSRCLKTRFSPYIVNKGFKEKYMQVQCSIHLAFLPLQLHCALPSVNSVTNLSHIYLHYISHRMAYKECS